jgi:branched-chain amino acid transport system ATP-binding protein
VLRAITDLKAQGLSILLVEQHMALALQVADDVHVLSRGRIMHASAPEALWHNQEVKARYLDM